MQGVARRIGIGVVVILVLLPGRPAAAQVTARELLSWCEGALGGSVTAEFDAFQCTTYLRAVLDQRLAAGHDLSDCLGTADPDATDLMARLVPDLRSTAAGSPGLLNRPASVVVAAWLADNCPPAAGGEANGEAESEPNAEPGAGAAEDAGRPGRDLPSVDAALLELEIWRSTQRIEAPARRRQAILAYLDTYPDGRFARLARIQLDDLEDSLRRGSAGTDEGDEDAVADGRGGPPSSVGPEPEPESEPESESEPEPEPETEPETEPEPGRDAASAPRPPVGTAPETPPQITSVTPPRPPLAPPSAQPSAQLDPVATLTRAQRVDVQASLQALGYYRLAIDGVFGPGTRAAIRAFQGQLGRAETGSLTEYELEKLFEMAPPPAQPPAATVLAPAGRTDPEDAGTPAVPEMPVSSPGFVARNFGSSVVVGIFASPPWDDSWRHNRLAGNVLLPGAEILIPLFEYQNECHFDIQFVDEHNFQRVYQNVDVCRARFVGFP